MLLSCRAGIIPLVLNRDIGGPIGKSVSDVAKVFTALNDFSMFPNGVDPRSVLVLLECFSARRQQRCWLAVPVKVCWQRHLVPMSQDAAMLLLQCHNQQGV